MNFFNIQCLLIAGMIFAIILTVIVLKNRLLGRLFFIAQFFAGIILVVNPSIIGRLATYVGVGRGTDLLLYCFIVFTYIGGLFMIAKFRKIEYTQTIIIRELALQKAIKI